MAKQTTRQPSSDLMTVLAKITGTLISILVKSNIIITSRERIPSWEAYSFSSGQESFM
jgi:hypothetical protein